MATDDDLAGDPIRRKRGDTAVDRITLTNADGSAFDATGFSFLLTVDVRRNPDDATTQLFQVGPVAGDASGEVDFAPSAGNVDQSPDEYWYDVQQTDTAGRTLTIRKNTYTFDQDISK